MDDSRTLASAAAAATEIDEDFYFDDDGFSSQQLGDGPWPPLELRPQGTAAQRLQVRTRHKAVMAGQAEFPDCQDPQCLGCRRSCLTLSLIHI